MIDEEPPAHGVLFVRGHEDGGNVVIVLLRFLTISCAHIVHCSLLGRVDCAPKRLGGALM